MTTIIPFEEVFIFIETIPYASYFFYIRCCPLAAGLVVCDTIFTLLNQLINDDIVKDDVELMWYKLTKYSAESRATVPVHPYHRCIR